MTNKRFRSDYLATKIGGAVLSALVLVACGGGGGGAPAAATGGTSSAVGTPKGDTTAGTINAVLVKTYNLKFFKGGGSGCGTVCTYAEAQSISAVVGADGSLTIDALKLTNPFYRKFGGVANTAEIIWLDATANVEYALTNNNSGTFNEINVGDVAKADKVLGVPGFIGQIR